jgi:hypothetical protein
MLGNHSRQTSFILIAVLKLMNAECGIKKGENTSILMLHYGF